LAKIKRNQEKSNSSSREAVLLVSW